MKIKKILKIFAVILFLFGVGCQDKPAEKPAEEKDGRAINNFTLVKTDGQMRKWTLEAKRAVFKEDEQDSKQILNIQDFSMTFHHQDRKNDTLLKGERGVYNRKTQKMRTLGKVVITRKDKKITTSNVRWDPEVKKFITDEEIEIKDNGRIIRGRGMEASMDLEKITIKEKVSGTVK
ncbi:MAG: LPS export ABC transporter periplasmic protein LptC [Elusimicrobiota bacterium]